MASNARNLANLLGTGQSTISAEKLGSDVPPGTEDYSSIDSLGVGTTIGETAFVEGSNRLYIWNGSGWYNIALINTTPTWDSGGQPAGAYELSVDSPQDATVITLAASDPEGLPISYNYITSGSMDSIATISQDSSVFTITPKTSVQAPDGGTGSITFRASDGINILPQVSSFTLNFISIITNSKYTTLLATADGTSDNNNITDASTNNHSITVNGDAHAGTFSPYRSGGYATSFSRSASSELEIASMPAIGSGDCSIEVWCKIDSQAWNGIISRGAYNSSGTFSLSSRSGDTELTLIWSGTIYTTSGANINAGEWKWVQVIRSSGTVTIYVNGSSVGSWSNSANVSSTSNYIIGRVDSSDYFGGDLRDLRISTNAQSSSNGSEKLATDSNTTFLSCHLPYLSYATSSVASNTYSSISGTIETVSNSPYDYTEYSATDHGGSVYFDGSGDTINTYHASNLQLGASSAFTLEFWFYANGTSSDYQSLFSTYSGSSVTDAGQSARLIFNTSNNLFILTDGSSNFLQITKDVPQNVWNHFCWTRDASNNHKFYFNGEQIGTSTTNTNFQTDWWYFGRRQFNGDQDFTGYISDISLIKGSVTRTSAFTPPTAPLSSTGTSFHIKGTDASIIDKSQGSNLKLVGNTTGSTTQVKFADTKSMYFDGTGDGIVVPHRDELNLDGCDWTIEYWFNVTNPGAIANWNFIQKGDNTTVRPYQINFRLDNNNGVEPRLFVSPNNSSQAGISNNAWQTFNAWHHVAFVRINSTGVITRYINGTANGTATSDVATNTEDLYIGTVPSGADEEGYIQDLRITKGLARYTANFTPPTASLEG